MHTENIFSFPSKSFLQQVKNIVQKKLEKNWWKFKVQVFMTSEADELVVSCWIWILSAAPNVDEKMKFNLIFRRKLFCFFICVVLDEKREFLFQLHWRLVVYVEYMTSFQFSIPWVFNVMMIQLLWLMIFDLVSNYAFNLRDYLNLSLSYNFNIRNICKTFSSLINTRRGIKSFLSQIMSLDLTLAHNPLAVVMKLKFDFYS